MKIMVVDDVATNRFLTRAILRKLGFDAYEAESCEEALKVHAKEQIDFFVLDWVMPGGMQGIDLVKQLRSIKGAQYVYIILLTAKNRKEDIAEGITAGADDYIIRPFDNNEFGTRVKMGTRNLALKRRIICLEKENRNLKKLLEKTRKEQTPTKPEQRELILPRGAIMDFFEQERVNCNAQNIPISIILLKIVNLKDISNPKVVNMVSEGVVQRINTVFPSCNLIGWFSKDELLLILPSVGSYQTKGVALSIRDSIEDKPLLLKNNVPFPIKADVGAGSSDSGNPLSVKEMIQLAKINI